LGVTGVGDYDQWYYEWRVITDPRWWNDYYLTNNYYSGQTPMFTGDYIEPVYALSSPSSPGEHNIAWGYYKFTFHLQNTLFSKYFYLDLRDANWSSEHPPYPSDPDTKIRWNNTIQKFEFKNKIYTNWTSFYASSDETIWHFFNISEPYQKCFQPTPPKRFRCTNANEQGAHPQFQWDPPDWPGMQREYRNLTTYYFIFRNNKFCAKDVTQLTWTDQNVIINNNGSNLTYYAQANVCHESPFSESSNSVIIKGSISKLELVKNISTDILINKTKGKSLSVMPNPFNPTTSIFFSIPEQAHVRLAIFNINGQKIDNLVNDFKYPGEYSVNFDGQSLAEGVYFVSLHFNNQHITRKILLLK